VAWILRSRSGLSLLINYEEKRGKQNVWDGHEVQNPSIESCTQPAVIRTVLCDRFAHDALRVDFHHLGKPDEQDEDSQNANDKVAQVNTDHCGKYGEIIKYTITPVAVTYNQIGHVTRANFRCFSTCIPSPRVYVNKTNGMMPVDSKIWEIRMKK